MNDLDGFVFFIVIVLYILVFVLIASMIYAFSTIAGNTFVIGFICSLILRRIMRAVTARKK
ncbi:hypothetical protein M2146_002560 [Lachnospiraceae bacterium PF1-22]